MPKKLAILFAYFLIYVVWGSTYYFIGVALHGFPTFLLSVLRFSTAGLILLVICACRGERVFIPRLVGPVGCERNHPAVHRYGGSDAGPAICQQ